MEETDPELHPEFPEKSDPDPQLQYSNISGSTTLLGRTGKERKGMIGNVCKRGFREGMWEVNVAEEREHVKKEDK
jgi:hypothetical protein